ncbi:MAG: hypothetical protein ABIR37_02565 [Candidatus Saccharimonadales bacterium]
MLRTEYPAELLPSDSNLVTALGKRTLALAKNKVAVLGSGKGPICCEEAEWKLAHSLLPEEVHDASQHSPLILTLHNKAVAVGKHQGQPSWYGLRNVPERNIHAGAFHAITNIPLAISLPRASTAYRYSMSPENTASIIRFSIYATPPSHRRDIKFLNEEAAIVRTTRHESIVKACDDYLVDANLAFDITNL